MIQFDGSPMVSLMLSYLHQNTSKKYAKKEASEQIKTICVTVVHKFNGPTSNISFMNIHNR